MSVLVGAAVLACVVLGTVVVLVREPLRQAMVASGYGVALTAVFVVYHAPDVALSAIVAFAGAGPMLALLALSRIGLEREKDRRQAGRDGADG